MWKIVANFYNRNHLEAIMSDLDDRDGSEEKVSRVLAWLSGLVTNKLLG